MRILAALALLCAGLLAGAGPAAAQEAQIESEGPLTRIITSADLNCQVAHRDDSQFEFYSPLSTIGSCGTFLAFGGMLYGPAQVSSGSFFPYAAWTPTGQTGVTGAGSTSEPFLVVTTVTAEGTGVVVEQTDAYVVGSQSYRTDIRINNTGQAGISGVLYRAGDCYLQESDTGFGRVDGGAPACVTSRAEGSRIEQWLPITPGSQFMEAGYGTVFAAVNSQQPLPNTCTCDVELDNGAGLSWPVAVAPGQSVVISHETFFSPVGRAPVQESFRRSVPSPLNITLDPIVVVQSVAITAGVILLVPFPSALFNNTLEENYDEVMSGVRRIRGWFAALLASIAGFVRRQVAARRQSGPSPPQQLPAESLEAASVPSPETTPPGPRPATDLWRTPQGMLLFVLLTALLYAFLDPTFGFSLESLATLAGLALGLLVVLFAYGAPLVLLARSDRVAVTIRALPATLLVGVLCVIVSRFADFQPGYLYGLVIGFFFAGTAGVRTEARAEAAAAAASLGVALIAWIALAVVRGDSTGGLNGALVEAALVTIVVAGLENAVFAMLPLRFLPGAAVFAWDRRVWSVLMGVGLFAFAHVLLNPASGPGYLADSTRTSFFTLIILLVGFGLASVLFWAWFRFRPQRQTADV